MIRPTRQPKNKETGYAITGDLSGTVVFHGAGFSIVNYARVTWIRNAPKVIYWGDIDAPGLQFVSDLRGHGVEARTILMDLVTLDRYRHLAVTGAGPVRHDLPNLEPPEQQLYAHLIQDAADHGTGLLLEQERISWPHAYQQLIDAIGSPLVIHDERFTTHRTYLLAWRALTFRVMHGHGYSA